MSKTKTSAEQRTGQRLTEEQIARSVAQQQEFMNLLREQLAARGEQLGPLQAFLQEQLPKMFAKAEAPLEIGEPEGLSPETMAALRAQAIEQVPARYADLRQRLRAQLASRGLTGGMGASGLEALPLSQIGIAEEQERAGGLRDIILRNEMARKTDLEARRQLAVNRRQLELQGLAGAFGGGSDLYRGILSRTEFSPFIGGVTGALGEAGQATGMRVSPGLIIPQRQPSIWGTVGRAALGAGMNLLMPGGGLWSLPKRGIRAPATQPPPPPSYEDWQ